MKRVKLLIAGQGRAGTMPAQGFAREMCELLVNSNHELPYEVSIERFR